MWLRIWNGLDRLFFGPASTGIGNRAAILRVLRYPYAVVRDLFGGEINLRAMGLVYTTLLTLIPLLALSFAVLKAFDASHDLEPIVHEFFAPMGEAGATAITSQVMQFAHRVSHRIVGIVGFAVLLWTLVGTIKKVEDSFNFLWRVEHARNLARRIAEYASVLIIGPVLLVGFLGVSRIAPVQHLRSLGLHLVPYVMVTAFFVMLYIFIPNTKVQLRPALIGASSAGVLWATVGKMFTALVVYSTRLTIVYAGFAFIVAALLWTYFGWLILLAGALLSFYIQNPSYLRLGLRELHLSSVELEQCALKLMYLVGRAQMREEGRWTVDRLAGELGLPGIAVTRLAHALEQASLLQVSEECQVILGRDIGRIGVGEILEVVRNQKSGHFMPRVVSVPAIDRLRTRLDAAWRECCSDESLRDLVLG